MATLARCLDISDSLDAWVDRRDAIAGGIASDALDQALGLLEQLAHGHAQELADAVASIVEILPPPLE